MTMKSEIRSAYVAGLSPLQLLMTDEPDHHRRIEPTSACDPVPAERRRVPLLRRRALLLMLTMGFVIGAWQVLSHTDVAPAAVSSHGPSGESTLLFVPAFSLTIGAEKRASRTQATRADVVAVPASAAQTSVFGA